MPLTNTHFNPFEKYGPKVESIKTRMEAIASKIEQAGGLGNIEDISKEVKNYESILENITEVAKNIEGHAIKALLSEVSVPFAAFIGNIGNRNSDQSKQFSILVRKVTRFMQTVADRVAGPYNSELLEEWAPVFISFLSSNQNSFKDNGALLWKRTFGTVKTPFEWPAGLRETLERMPKKHGIVLPAAAKLQDACTIEDDDAMDGLPMCSGESEKSFKLPDVTSEVKQEAPESQTSFQFSQQGVADNVAEKLLSEKRAKVAETRTQKATLADTPPRKRAPKLSLFDEDSCDFTPIVNTPPSVGKSRLTDRQKEKLAEASGPNTSINYINEESQTGFQKSEKLKNAFSNLFELEDSCSQSFSNSTETSSAHAEKCNIENASSHSSKNSSKRPRKLFDSPVKSLPTTTSYRADKNIEMKDLEKASETSPKSPMKKMSKSVESTTGNAEENEDGDLEKLPKVDENHTPRRKSGRTKNIPKQCIPGNTTCSQKNSLTSSNIEEMDHTSEGFSKPTCSMITSNHNQSTELPDENTPAPRTDSATIDVSNSKISSTEPLLECSEVSKSPPKTPRTPSILRVGKRAGDPSSPLTDRKKNRVHFGADSLPKETSASPLTPRRRPVPEETNQEGVVPSTLERARSMKLFPDDQPLADFATTAFFPSLINCSEKIERIIPSLLQLRMNLAETVKKSFQVHNIKTIGEFARLSKSRVEEFPWFNAVKAKAALSLFEKTWKMEEPAKNEVTVGQANEASLETDRNESSNTTSALSAAKIPLVNVDMNDGFGEDSTSAVSQNELEFSMNTVENVQNSVVLTASEKSTSITSANQNCQEEGQIQEDAPEVITTPEASQSPASPMSIGTTSIASSDVSTKAAVPKETLAVVSRKNLAPIFLGKTNRLDSSGEQKKAEYALLEDTRQLSQVSLNLLTASIQNKLTKDNSSPLLVNIHRAAAFFKYLVQSHKEDSLGDWDEVEFGIMPSQEISVEQEVKNLMAIHKRFLRRNAQATSDSLPWKKVLEPISESSCLLEGLYRDRIPKN